MRYLRHACARPAKSIAAVLILTLTALTVVVAMGTASVATPGVDDYPAYLRDAAQDSKTDPWLFYNRECTSFVAWRMNNDNHVGFSNYMRGPNGKTGHFGDAANWGANARAIGFPVNNTPAVGAIAWWSSGHVAWVRTVNGGTVVIEEYNYNYQGTYHTRSIAAGAPTGYIHIADLDGSAGGTNPQGSFDETTGLARDTVRVRGWAFDGDQKTSPIGIHAYIDGPAGSGARGVDLGPAQLSRPDVAAAYPGVGINHGFDGVLTGVAPGAHTIYLYAINVGTGSNVSIGTKSVNVPATAAGSPVGNLEDTYGLPGGSVRVRGWTVDPGSTASTDVHVYIDGPAGSGARGVSIGRAKDNRPDVGAAYPGTGNAHGFDAVVDGIAGGWHTAWVYGINASGGGENPLILARSFYVPTGAPIGNLDSVDAIPNGVVRINGWSVDPDGPTATTDIHVYVDGPAGSGTFHSAHRATMPRPDVTTVYPTATGDHGFDFPINGISPGQHTFYVYAINATGAGDNPLIGTRTITVPSSPAGSPFGNLDVVQGRAGSLRVAGWALDNDAPLAPIDIHVYVGGPAGTPMASGYNLGKAGGERQDVGAAFPGTGNNHGFDFTLQNIRPGQRPVYVYAINTASGENVAIGGGSAIVSADTHRPSVKLKMKSHRTKSRHITIKWKAVDADSGLAYTQLRWRSRANGGRFGHWISPASVRHLTSTKKRSLAMSRGRTYCYQARSFDYSGNASAWTSSACVKVVA
jgi:surface antigen